MAATRVLTQEEREAVLARVKPSGSFRPPKERQPFGSSPMLWEKRLGDLDEFRKHPGMGRAVVEKLTDPAKTASVQMSMVNRLRRLHPEESWSTFLDDKFIYLKFSGIKKAYSRTAPKEAIKAGKAVNDGGLFSVAS